MRSKKLCYGALLVLSIMLGLSLSVSSNVNAYQYNIDNIPFIVPQPGNNNGFVLYDPLQFRATDSFQSVGDDAAYMTTSFDSSSGDCYYQSVSSIDGAGSSTEATFRIPFFLFPTDNSWNGDISGSERCMTYLSMPSFDVSSIPSPLGAQLRSFLPYRFPYNMALLNSSYTEDGLNIRNKLDFSQLFLVNGNRAIPDVDFTYIDIPLGISTVKFNAGDHVEIKGEFLFDSDDVNSVFTLNPNSTLTLRTELLTDYNTYRSAPATSNRPTSVSCTMSAYSNPNPSEAPYILDYSCPFDIQSDTGLSGFTLQFRGPSNQSVPGYRDPIFTYPDMSFWVYDSSVVVTNYDESPDPSGQKFQSLEFAGNIISQTPGHSIYGSGIIIGNVDYSSSLTNMFNFNLINPFYPIFSLFSDNDSCAQIPTLAGMLHSEETQICPWFDSNTRRIVTPVVGLSSLMLLFGFIVRWLSGSSGNMFVDDDVKDTGGGFSLLNKYRRRK